MIRSFFRAKKYFNRNDSVISTNLNIDYENTFALAGLIGSIEDSKMIALCSYERDRDTNMGEIAFTVHKDWRDQGITKYMLHYLIRIAMENGLEGFQGEIMWENQKMVHLIRDSGYIIKGKSTEEGWLFSFRFDERV